MVFAASFYVLSTLETQRQDLRLRRGAMVIANRLVENRALVRSDRGEALGRPELGEIVKKHHLNLTSVVFIQAR